MSASIPHYSAEQVHAALEYPSLIERLRQAFASGASVPLRHAHKVNEHENARLLLMPAWREGEALGVKIVTAFPGNTARGAATVAATYVLLDGSTGHPLAFIDGEALTLRRTAAASALASSFLSRADSKTLLVVDDARLHLPALPLRTPCGERLVESLPAASRGTPHRCHPERSEGEES